MRGGESRSVIAEGPEGALPAQAEALLRKLPESLNVGVVRHNLSLMLGSNMQNLLMNESVGGNGGHVALDGEKYSATGANGYFDSENGMITTFGNVQEVDQEIVETNGHFIMHILLDKLDVQRIRDGSFRGFFHISEIQYLDECSAEAEQVLEAGRAIYNDLHA